MTTLPQTLRPDGEDPHDPADEPMSRGRNGYANGRSHSHGGYNGGSANLPALPSMPVVSTPVTMPTAGGGGGGGAGLTGADVMRVLRENLWLIILAAIISGAAGFGINEWLKKNFLSYKASGQLLARDSTDDIYDPEGTGSGIGSRGNGEKLEVRVLTQVAGLKNPEIFNNIVQENETVREASWLQREARGPGGKLDPQEAVETLMDNFNASPLKGSRLINVSFTADDPRQAADILNVIVNTRLDELRRRGSDELNFDISELGLIIEQRGRDLDELDAQIRSIRSAAQGGGGSASSSGMLMSEMGLVMRARAEAQEQAELLKQLLQNAKESVARGQEPAGVEMELNRNPTVARLRQQLEQIEQSLDLSRARLGDGHPSVAQTEQTRDALANRLADAEQDARATARNQVVAGLEAQLEAAERTAAKNDEEFQRLDTRFTQLTRDEADLQMFRNERGAKSLELKRFGRVLR